MVQPYWVLETWANFQYHNHLGSRIFDTTRLLEPLFRDPWWVFTTVKLVMAIRENYEFTIPGLVRTSPRFGIMLLCLLLSIIFLVTDVIFMIVVSKRGGMNPFWKASLIFDLDITRLTCILARSRFQMRIRCNLPRRFQECTRPNF